MELVISEKLKDRYDASVLDDKKFTLFTNIRSNGGDSYTEDLVSFLNNMIRQINDKLTLGINDISNNEDIRVNNTLEMYMAMVIDSEGIEVARICIANAAKKGNVLITQQIMSDLLTRENDDTSYVVDTSIKRVVYLAFDCNKYDEDSLGTLKPLLRASKTMGMEIIEMFPSKHKIREYITVPELIDDLNENRREYNSENTIKLVERGTGGMDLVLDFEKDPVGQAPKYYTFYLMAIYVINHPRLVYKQDGIPYRDYKNIDINLQKMYNIFNRDIPYTNDETVFDDANEHSEIREIPEGHGQNLLVYGAPGTGKSYGINKEFPNYSRVTFFPDYDYTQFIGGLKPTRNESGQLDYEFIPGVFTDVLVEAYNNPLQSVGLIIEELNRANAASVFADVFQLLDRDDKSISEYSIRNRELENYLDRSTGYLYNFGQNGVRIPGNVDIIATMNPADQGVLPVDAAFKRRWRQKYTPINWNDKGITQKNVAGFNLPWKELGQRINEYLSDEFDIEEDALLGQFFLTDSDILDKDRVSSKLLGYLWNDVVRYNRGELFSSNLHNFSQVQQAFKNDETIFVPALEDSLGQ